MCGIHGTHKSHTLQPSSMRAATRDCCASPWQVLAVQMQQCLRQPACFPACMHTRAPMVPTATSPMNLDSRRIGLGSGHRVVVEDISTRSGVLIALMDLTPVGVCMSCPWPAAWQSQRVRGSAAAGSSLARTSSAGQSLAHACTAGSSLAHVSSAGSSLAHASIAAQDMQTFLDTMAAGGAQAASSEVPFLGAVLHVQRKEFGAAQGGPWQPARRVRAVRCGRCWSRACCLCGCWWRGASGSAVCERCLHQMRPHKSMQIPGERVGGGTPSLRPPLPCMDCLLELWPANVPQLPKYNTCSDRSHQGHS